VKVSLDRIVGVKEAARNLPSLIARVAGDEPIVLTRRGQPCAALVSVGALSAIELDDEAIERMGRAMHELARNGGGGDPYIEWDWDDPMHEGTREYFLERARAARDGLLGVQLP
jgi:prevent-host-death family protein